MDTETISEQSTYETTMIWRQFSPLFDERYMTRLQRRALRHQSLKNAYARTHGAASSPPGTGLRCRVRIRLALLKAALKFNLRLFRYARTKRLPRAWKNEFHATQFRDDFLIIKDKMTAMHGGGLWSERVFAIMMRRLLRLALAEVTISILEHPTALKRLDHFHIFSEAWNNGLQEEVIRHFQKLMKAYRRLMSVDDGGSAPAELWRENYYYLKILLRDRVLAKDKLRHQDYSQN